MNSNIRKILFLGVCIPLRFILSYLSYILAESGKKNIRNIVWYNWDNIFSIIFFKYEINSTRGWWCNLVETF
jgi:hypothetical protein